MKPHLYDFSLRREFLLLLCAVQVLAVGCGVKGKPLPPLEPAQIGRGAPTYKRTAEQAKPSEVNSVTPSPTPDGRGR